MNPDEFVTTLNNQSLPISNRKMVLFQTYLEFLLEYSKKVNLTAIKEPKDIWLKHFYDSLTPLLYLPDMMNKKASLIDIGSGAGFPGVPLKIVNQKFQLTLLDSLQKRIAFLDQLIDKLNLKNVETVHGRAEDFAHNLNYREKYDFAIARAVSNTNTLL
ncbi:16S rRNA (guanine(527)-N(7))-methyltransferase RsmG, partial [Oenococcus oeni]|uniref:16S rRNA (guanine(527)-N(7))-methyltransferase RsmG n=2 Tax=Oenococcus oeni TaxID=1247 RepID=UPI0008F89FB5